MNGVLLKKDLEHHLGEFVLVVLCELGLVISLGAQLDNLTAQVLLTLAFAISFIAGFVFSFRTVASEDGSTGMAFLLSLPITRGQIVVSKFVANWILALCNFLAVWGGVLLYCLYRNELDVPDASLLLNFILLQLLSSSFYLSCAILFNSARAIWMPFPLLVIGVNLAFNWQRVAVRLPQLPANPLTTPLLLAAGSLALLGLTWHVFGKTAVRHEWS